MRPKNWTVAINKIRFKQPLRSPNAINSVRHPKKRMFASIFNALRTTKKT